MLWSSNWNILSIFESKPNLPGTYKINVWKFVPKVLGRSLNYIFKTLRFSFVRESITIFMISPNLVALNGCTCVKHF